MDFLKGIFNFSLTDAVDAIGGVADKFHTSTDEKNAFKLEVQKLLEKRDEQLQQTIRQELEAKERIIVAELNQGDSYTKRARPTVVYFGLLVIFVNYVLFPFASVVSGNEAVSLPLPTEFWVAWGGIVGTWVLGRSSEKKGVKNTVVSTITGNAAPKTSLFN